MNDDYPHLKKAELLNAFDQPGLEYLGFYAKGFLDGQESTAIAIASHLLYARIGGITEAQLESLKKLRVSDRQQLCVDLLEFNSMGDFKNWLSQHTNENEYL